MSIHRLRLFTSWSAATLLGLACTSADAPEEDATESAEATDTVDADDASSSTGASIAHDSTTDPTGGDTSAASEDTGAAVPAECIATQAHLVGSVDGTSIDGAFMWWGFMAGADTVVLDFGTDGALVLHALEYAESPEPAAVRGWLRMPAEDPRAGTWYCIGEGSQYVTDAEVDSVQATLVEVAELGACPGTPVAGSATICYGDPSCGGAFTFTSDTSGNAFAVPLGEVVGTVGPIGGTEITVEHMFGGTGGGWVSMHAIEVAADPAPTVAPIDRAVFTVPDGLPDAGAVYCASGSLTHVAGEPVAVELDTIARIGSCADTTGDGNLEICMSR